MMAVVQCKHARGMGFGPEVELNYIIHVVSIARRILSVLRAKAWTGVW